MDNAPQISIIVPAYNCEGYISRCLDSLLHQRASLQIIVINDGSTDKTAQLVEEYLGRSDSITLINIENSGVSAARNCGLNAAKGEYIMFCDADDWFEPDTIHLIAEQIRLHNADIGRFNAYRTTDNGRTVMKLPIAAGFYNKQQLRDRLLFEMIGPSSPTGLNSPTRFAGAVWNQIIKREIIADNGIKFDTELFHGEDLLFDIAVLMKCRSIVVSDICAYNYYVREGSAVRSFNPRISGNTVSLIKKVDRLTEEGGIFEQTAENRRLNRAKSAFIIAEYIFSASNNLTSRQRLQAASEQLDVDILNEALSGLDLNGVKPVYKALYRCLMRKNYKGYMHIKNFRNFIFRLRHKK